VFYLDKKIQSESLQIKNTPGMSKYPWNGKNRSMSSSKMFLVIIFEGLKDSVNDECKEALVSQINDEIKNVKSIKE
jgi:hypothetical protein